MEARNCDSSDTTPGRDGTLRHRYNGSYNQRSDTHVGMVLHEIGIHTLALGMHTYVLDTGATTIHGRTST
jgi:hypothetical protein